MRRISQLAAYIGILASSAPLCLAQELAIPDGWTASSSPPFLSVQPDEAPAGVSLRVEVWDPEPADGELNEWLKQQILRVRTPEEALAKCRTGVSGKSTATCYTTFDGADHHFTAIRLAGGQYRFLHVHMAPQGAAAKPYIPAITQIVRSAAAGDGRSTSHSARAEGILAPTEDPPVPAENPPATPPPPAAPTAPASAGMLPIEAVYLHQGYSVGVGGMVIIEYEPYVFLKDGTVTDDLSFYPSSESEIAQWRSRKPRAWGQWTRATGKISIRWNDPKRKPETWDKWFDVRRAGDGWRPFGTYQSLGGGGNTALGGDVMVAAWKDFQFQPDGTVITGGGSGSTSGGQGTGVSVATSSQQARQTARYRFEEYAVVLEYADGRRERRWFYRFPDSDDVIGIGASTYSLRKTRKR